MLNETSVTLNTEPSIVFYIEIIADSYAVVRNNTE